MRTLLPMAVLVALFARADGGAIQGKKVYECRYMANAPYGVTAWSQSEMVRTGAGKEARFVPYNSAAAKGLILDATAVRDVNSDPKLKGRETSFYMVYDSKGWYVYIHCQEPQIQTFVDERKDVALEIFFSPGLERVPYYQMIVRQLTDSVKHYDWGMPHRHYRMLKDSVKTESLPIKTGYATFLFIPWEGLYDRLPLKGDHWRFSMMRWGPSMTWGGKVHDTGHFGLVHFQAPTASQRHEIDKRILRTAWFRFRAVARKTAAFWSDEKLGDLDFYRGTLKPVIDQYTALGESLGKPDGWDADTVTRGRSALADWMEFRYKVAELRTECLMAKRFAESR
ncbi:hypothetical protein ACFL09_01470 [Planctomycetota bacterium]